MPKVICDPPALPSALPTANPLFLEGYQIKGGSKGGWMLKLEKNKTKKLVNIHLKKHFNRCFDEIHIQKSTQKFMTSSS